MYKSSPCSQQESEHVAMVTEVSILIMLHRACFFFFFFVSSSPRCAAYVPNASAVAHLTVLFT